MIDCARILCLLLAANGHDVYVAPDGDDANPGTLERPFATLERARDTVRGARRPTTVWLRGGAYSMRRALELSVRDTGTAQAPITFAAYKDETPVLSAGRPVTGWTRAHDGLWKASLPDVKAGKWKFHQLFTRRPGRPYDERRYRPTLGLFVVAGLTDAPHKFKGRVNHRNPQKEFMFHKGDIQPWANMADVEVVAMHDWSSGRLHIESVDWDRSIVRFTEFPHYRIGHWYPGGRNPYLVENVKEALGKPGEWYLDRPTGVLLYKPAPGEDMDSLRVVAPRIERLLVVTGDRDKQAYVEHVTFRGITFAHTAWAKAPHLYAEDYKRACRQGFVDMPAAIELKWARACRFERCVMAHVGAYAIDLGEGCHDNAVAGCRIFDCGAGGVKVGVVDRKASPPVVSTNNRIENNVVSDTGIVHYSGHSIWGGMTSGARIRHNEVTRSLYSAVAVGWAHDTQSRACRENVMEYNHIHDVMLLLDHGGALYTLGSQPGTVIRGNLIHGTHQTRLHGKRKRPIWAGNAFGFDDGSGGFIVEDNIIYDTPSPPDLFLHRKYNMQKIGVNYLGVAPTDPKFPRALVARAGLEPAYRDILKPAIRVNAPAVLTMKLPTDARPLRIMDSFERARSGESPRRGYARVEDKGPGKGKDAIVVTDRTAASGKHSLLIQDAPGLSRPWLPYLSYNPGYDAGAATVSFDLRVDAGATLEHAWRGRAEKREFSVGPQFTVKEGKLFVADKMLAPFPAGQWLHVKVTARLGKPDPGIGGAGRVGAGLWTLELTAPGARPRTFRSLPFAHKEFSDLNWVGFISLATDKAACYLDNVDITCE